MSHDMLTCTHLQFQLQFLQSIFQFYYPKDSKQQQNLLGCIMLWEFDILLSPTSQPVPPHVPETSDEHLDDSLPPVNLELAASCNCHKKPLNPVCLVNIPVPVGLEEETLGNDKVLPRNNLSKTASRTRLFCVHFASETRASCVRLASSLRPNCRHFASIVRAPCVHCAGTVRPPCGHFASALRLRANRHSRIRTSS